MRILQSALTALKRPPTDEGRDRRLLLEAANYFRDAKREGMLIDNPEGSRYIQISETLAIQIEQALRKAAKRV